MVKLIKWLEEDEPTEAKIQTVLESEGMKTNGRSEGAGTTKDPQPAGEDITLCVVEGMARITLPDSGDELLRSNGRGSLGHTCRRQPWPDGRSCGSEIY